MEERNEFFDLIITLLKSIKSQQNIHGIFNNKIHELKSADNYILGQVLRRYCLTPEDKIFVSEKAQKLWNEISPNEDIKTYTYNKRVICQQDVRIPRYNGHNTNPERWLVKKKGDKFPFNDVFHEEHTITIDMIIKDKLLKLTNFDNITNLYNELDKILDNIYICIMLKEEDRNIKHSKKRVSHNIIEVVEDDYVNTKNKTPIKIVDWENIKKKIEEKQKAVK